MISRMYFMGPERLAVISDGPQGWSAAERERGIGLSSIGIGGCPSGGVRPLRHYATLARVNSTLRGSPCGVSASTTRTLVPASPRSFPFHVPGSLGLTAVPSIC